MLIIGVSIILGINPIKHYPNQRENMNLQRLIAAPIAFGLIIGNFPLLAADAKNVNISASNTSFNIAMDANQDAENAENTTENQVAEAPENEENQASEEPENEENSDSETTVEEPAEVIEESQPSVDCPEGKSPHPIFGRCISDWMNRRSGQDCINAEFGSIASVSRCKEKVFDDSKPSKKAKKKPDLIIKNIRFNSKRQRIVRVLVANIGNAPAKSNILKLTIRRVKGKNVRRTIKVIAPRLKKKQSKWIVIRAKKLLPKKVAIKNTKFRLFIDASKVIREKNEKNNVYWHNR